MKMFVMAVLLLCLLPLVIMALVAHDEIGFGPGPFDTAWAMTLSIMAVLYMMAMFLILRYATFG